MARPRLTLTPGDLTKLESVIHTLDDTDDIATYLGVSSATVKRWMKAGRDLEPGDPDFRRQFCTIVQCAREGSKRTLLGVLTRAAVNGDISAAKYLLDRVHKLSANVSLSNPDGSAIGTARTAPTVDLSKLTTDELTRYHEAQATLLALTSTMGDRSDGDDVGASETPEE